MSTPSEPTREQRRRAFGVALIDALAQGQLSRSEFARRYAEATGSKVTPSKVSEWCDGQVLPENGDPEAVYLIERLVGVAPGSLSRHLGFLPLVSAGCTVETAVERDPLLDEGGRVGLLGSYRALVTLALKNR